MKFANSLIRKKAKLPVFIGVSSRNGMPQELFSPHFLWHFHYFWSMRNHELNSYLLATESLNFNSPEFEEFFGKAFIETSNTINLIRWYEYVRDYFLYDPYHLDIRKSALISSKIVEKRRAWCVEKAIVFVAGARKMGFPARLGFGVVQNHIGVDKLQEYLKREEIAFHGYAEVFIENQWVKCTPAFDKRVCAINKLEPLAWDGRNDSLFQAYSGDAKFMEYLHFYGEFGDIPYQLMHSEMKKYYPHLFSNPIDTKMFSFHFDADLA